MTFDMSPTADTMKAPEHTSIVMRTLREIMAKKGKKHVDLVRDECALRTVQRYLPQKPGVEPREIPGATLDVMIALLEVSHAAFYKAMAKRAKEEAKR
jgi:hypothetical protein